jgi:hypothetical protein
MQSFHPDMPAWLQGPSASPNGKPRSPGGSGAKSAKEAFSEVLRAASAAGRGKAAAAAAACAAAHGSAGAGASLVGGEASAGGRAGATAVRTTATAPPPPPPPATPPPLLPPWQEARDDAGRTYYYHPTTKATSWHRPSAQTTPRTGPASARPPLSAHRPQSAPRTRPHSSGPGAPSRPSLGGLDRRPSAQHGRASDGHLHAQRRDGGSGCSSGSGVTSRSSTPRAGAPLMAPPPPRDPPARG